MKDDPKKGVFKKYRRNYVAELWFDYRFLVFAIICILSFYLGYAGLKKYYAASGEKQSVFDIVYLTLQLFVMQSGAPTGAKPWELEMARFLAPAVTLLTAAEAMFVIFYEKIQRFFLKFMDDHIIICGLGRKGWLMAREFVDRGERVLVIEEDENNSLLEPCRNLGMTTVTGNALDAELLKRARIDRAKYLIAMLDDGANAEIAVTAYELADEKRESILTCFVHVIDPALCSLLREREIMTEKVDAFRLEFFNIFDNGTRALLKEHPPFSDGKISRAPHVLIVGLGHMGESILTQTARLWRYRSTQDGGRIGMTVVDKIADAKVALLLQRYPQISKYCDITPVSLEIGMPEFHCANFLENEKCGPVSIIYICIDNDALALTTALALFRRTRERETPIVIRMTHETGFARILRGVESNRGDFDNIYSFGLLERTCNPECLLDGTHEILARSIHEIYLKNLADGARDPKANPAAVEWEALPAGLKESNRRQADHIGLKLMAIGCAITTPLTDWDAESFRFEAGEVEMMAKMEHERWLREKTSEGWLGAAGSKDPAGRTHPDMVAWDSLSEEGKNKNRESVKALPWLLASAGFQVYRSKNIK